MCTYAASSTALSPHQVLHINIHFPVTFAFPTIYHIRRIRFEVWDTNHAHEAKKVTTRTGDSAIDLLMEWQ